MSYLSQQMDPQCHHRQHYGEHGSLLLEMQHNNYNNVDERIEDLLNLIRQNRSSSLEILIYHLKGNASFFHEKYDDAIKHYEYAISLARESGNFLALVEIGFELIKTCNIKQRYDVFFETFNEIVQTYQKLDLVDEKIHCLMQLSHYYRVFGNYNQAQRTLTLAMNLHDTMEDCMVLPQNCVHNLYIKMALAHLEKKNHNFFKALDLTKSILGSLEENEVGHGVHESNIGYLKLECFIIIGESCIETKNREKSITNLDQIRKLTQKIPDPIAQDQCSILRMLHELNFEKHHFTERRWLALMKNILDQGGIEFYLEQNLRLLQKLHDVDGLKDCEAVIDDYQSTCQKISHNMPKDLVKYFSTCYEVMPVLSLRSSAKYQMKKFVEMGHELLCEHNLQELASKMLQFVQSLTKMENGFVKINDSKSAEMVTVRSDPAHGSESSHSPRCEELADLVFAEGKPFIKTSAVQMDLQQFMTKHSELIDSIQKPSIIILPLLVNRTSMGVIYLDSPQKHIIKNEEDVELLISFVALMTNVIHNAPHLEWRKFNSHESHTCSSVHHSGECDSKYHFDCFIGISEKVRNLIELMRHTVDTSTTVTLTGNSGVGKEMIARILHYNSPRKSKPFITINCAAIPENLIESELFGHAKGAFTDAKENKMGLFQKADQGTLFLDEIGDMPLNMQSKLLRVLQEREITPVGGTTNQKIDVKIICATNRNLEKMVKSGAFREDLFYRISVIKIHVPSLCERKEDIPLLVDHALKMFAEENKTMQKNISHQAMSFLMKYAWPGNVRELVNVIYNLCIFVDKPIIELKDLEDRKELFSMPIDPSQGSENQSELSGLIQQIDAHQISLAEAKQAFERLQIERALKIFNGQITSASYHLQMPRPQVSRLIKKYEIDKKKYKDNDERKE